MVQTTDVSTQPSSVDELKKKIRKLNSKAGQMKMDLHDIAEGLPADLDQLPEMAAKTYDIFCQLRELKQQLKTLENA
ncbi:MAG: CCE_0567 family metalloprotein [Leptolyngbyaceae bacterium]|nr:CCE_0567 family metalloprotein [Leptolyngbyaceae bacterium]